MAEKMQVGERNATHPMYFHSYSYRIVNVGFLWIVFVFVMLCLGIVKLSWVYTIFLIKSLWYVRFRHFLAIVLCDTIRINRRQQKERERENLCWVGSFVKISIPLELFSLFALCTAALKKCARNAQRDLIN